MFAWFKSLFGGVAVVPSDMPLHDTRKMSLPEIAVFHGTITPQEVDSCGITNGMGPHEVVYRTLQLRAGEQVTGNYLPKLAALVVNEKR